MRNNTKEYMEHIRSMRSKEKPTIKVSIGNFSEEELDEYLKGVSPSLIYAYKQAFSGKRNFRAIVKAKCLDCVGFEDYTNNIRQCSVKFCPLWPWRPYR